MPEFGFRKRLSKAEEPAAKPIALDMVNRSLAPKP